MMYHRHSTRRFGDVGVVYFLSPLGPFAALLHVESGHLTPPCKEAYLALQSKIEQLSPRCASTAQVPQNNADSDVEIS